MPLPFLQAFLFAMENGAVYMVFVVAEDKSQGEGLAIDFLRNVDESQIYDMCSFPITGAYKFDLHGDIRKLRERESE